MFKGFSKVLIYGGYDPYMFNCEVIDLESSETACKSMQKYPARVYGAIGGLGFRERPIICGGFQDGVVSNQCYSLENNDWVLADSMISARWMAAAAQLKMANF